MLQLILGAACISFSAVFVKLAHVSALSAAFYRMGVGGLGLLIAMALAGRLGTIRGPLVARAMPCAIFFALDLWTWHLSINIVGPGMGTLLGNFQVFVLALTAVLIYKQKTGPVFWLSMGLAVVGLYAMVGVGFGARPPEYGLGVLYGLSTAFFYGLYILSLQKAVSGFSASDPLAITAMLSLGAAAIIGCGMLALGDTFAIPDTASVLSLLAYGLICQSLGSLLISRGLMLTPTVLAGLILLLQPVLAYVWDIVFFAKPMSAAELSGAALALVGIYLGSSWRKKA
ncbi:DMT family transporter [Desulfovibrio sulfodismutans]|uniref:DMT family transporter n=1 Tax=Desulfolutivibrio sulfodismutans TaxID=63561 RepID=A0A7K3NRQ7_9BACT|nr:DMT family transporter [Desulfolutivibrio sulfodismutans]NDY58870.1 DMT family transporter [Desulfolutivibrio sulfodismutans]QLA10832.1 EamA family transporter [Desulfolutivibrio sulfodismutans DSM 3696]